MCIETCGLDYGSTGPVCTDSVDALIFRLRHPGAPYSVGCAVCHGENWEDCPDGLTHAVLGDDGCPGCDGTGLQIVTEPIVFDEWTIKLASLHLIWTGGSIVGADGRLIGANKAIRL